MDINLKDDTSYTTQWKEVFLKYVENEQCAKHRCVPVNKPENMPAAISSPPQWLQDPINHCLIHMTCPALLKIT